MNSGHSNWHGARFRRHWFSASVVIVIAIGALITLSAVGQQGGAAGQSTGQGSSSTPVQPTVPGGRGGRGGARGPAGTSVLGPNGEMWGFSDSAFNAGSRWRIHDPARPQPPVVTPGPTVSIPPPSDAIVLFDGASLSAWVTRAQDGTISPAGWAVHDGYFESGPGGAVSTRENFGDV